VKKIVLLGPGPCFKGGIAHYNTSLALALEKTGQCEVHIVSWTQQYPSIIPRDFLDRKSKASPLDGTSITTRYVLNYNNPYTWYKTCRIIRALNPDVCIVQWSISLQGLPLGLIIRNLKKHGIRVGIELHNVKQKENSAIDAFLTRLGIGQADFYIAHGQLTIKELQEIFPFRKYEIILPDGQNPSGCCPFIIKLYHPVYNMFRRVEPFDATGEKERMGLKRHVFLFFGFIRKYKGLHHAIEAFALLASRRDDVSLLIVGESFWQTLDNKKLTVRLKQFLFGLVKKIFLRRADDEQNYRPLDLIRRYHLEHCVKVVNEFVPNEEVYKYFQVADALLLFYTYATPSGVESIAYNFGIPVVATRVGNFSETIQEGVTGYLAEPGDIRSMAEAMEKIIHQPLERSKIEKHASLLSWERYSGSILRTLFPS